MRTISLATNEEIALQLPDGRQVCVLLSHLEDDSLPELDIYLPTELAANCFRKGLVPSSDVKNNVIFDVRQITIPLSEGVDLGT